MLNFEKATTVPDGLARIFRNCLIQEHYFKDPDRLERSLAEGAAAGELYLGTENGQIVAVMRVSMRGFCGLYPYIKLLGVAPEARGRGIGSFMLDRIEALAHESGAKRITLMVSDFNEHAQAFYARHGYERLGTVRSAVKDGIDEHVMIKYLD